MKNRVSYLQLCILAIAAASCNQQPKKTETAENKTGPGEFDRTVLPILPHPFAGKVDTNASQSTPDFPVGTIL